MIEINRLSHSDIKKKDHFTKVTLLSANVINHFIEMRSILWIKVIA